MNERLLIAMAADRTRFRRTNTRRDNLFAATMLVPVLAVGVLAVGKVLTRPGLSLPSMVEEARAQQTGAPVPAPVRPMPQEPGTLPPGLAPGATIANPSSGVRPLPYTAPDAATPPPATQAATGGATPVATGNSSAAVTVLLEQASYWRNQSQYDQALESLNRALALDPNNRDALALLGQIEADRGNAPAAQAALARLRAVSPDDPRIEKIDRALRIGPITPEALTDARRLASQGHQAEAVDRYNRVFKGNQPPDNYSVEYYQTLAGTEGGWDQARDGLARAVRQNPQDLKAQLAYAEVLTYRDETRSEGIARLAVLARNPAVADQATQAWRQALGWLPDNKSSLQPLTVYLQGHPNDTDIANKLEMARNPSTASNDPLALQRNAGFDALNAGKLAAAAAAFEKTLAQNPNDSDALGGLGIVRLRQRRFGEARTLLARAIAANPGERGHWQAALNGANRAIAGAGSGGGGGGGSLAAPAQALLNRGDYAGAERELRKAIATGRDNSGGLQAMLADAQAQQGRLGDAEASYRDALAHNAHNVGAMIGLSGVLSREGRSDEAQKLLAQAESEGGGRQAGQARALVLREQAENITDPATQAAIYREAVSSDPSNPWIRLDLARALLKLRDLGQARSVMSATARAGASVDDLKAAVIFANETNDPDAAAALIARLPAADRTPDLRALAATAAVQREITAALAGAPQVARQQLVRMATRPDPDGTRGAAIARALARLGDQAGAREAINLAQSSTPGQGPTAKLAYTTALLEIHDHDGAARELAQVDPARGLTAAQREAYARLSAGLAVVSADELNRRGRLADAYDQLAPGLARNPDNPDLNMALARIYQGARDPREALQINEALLARDPQNAEVRRAAIRAALQAGDRAHADALVRDGLQLSPNDPRMWMASADVAKAAGNTGRALRDLERARELRLQQLGYAESGADGSTVTGVSLVPGAPVHYGRATPAPVLVLVPAARAAASGNADGGADISTLPWYAGGRVIAQVDTGPAVPTSQAAPVPATSLSTPPSSGLRPPSVPVSPNDLRTGGGAAPAAATAPDYRYGGRMLDTSPTSLPPPHAAATQVAQSTDELNEKELNSVRAQGAAGGASTAPPPPGLLTPAPAAAATTTPARVAAPTTAAAAPAAAVATPAPAAAPVVTAQPLKAPASPTAAYQPPAIQAPTAQAPVAQAPVAQAPAAQTPVAQAPAAQVPAYQPPSYQPPSYQAQNTPPAYQPPSYQAPTYQPPAYQTPVYRPPSYYAGLQAGPQAMARNAPAPIPGTQPAYNPPSYYPPAYYPPPPPRADSRLYAGPSVLNDASGGGGAVGGYYANPFRPSPSGQPPSSQGFPAANPLYQPDPETAQIDSDIIALRQQVSPALQGGVAFRVRSGDSGLDKLTELDAPITGEASPGGFGRLKVTATPTYLESGSLGGDVTSQQRFGTGALSLLPGNAANNFVNTYTGVVPKSQYATGVGLDASYAYGVFTGDIGTSPLGFLLPSVVGGVELSPKLSDNVTLRLTGERRAMTDSILSYAGTRDPNTGIKWGGEDRTRGHANLEWGVGDKGGYIYVGGGGGTVTGTHVVSNTEADAGAGGSFPVYTTPTQQLRVGLDLVYFGYNKNLRFFSLGQGGYFSPQSYAAALIPVTWKEQVDDDFSYEVGVAAGLQTYHENSSNYYPDDPALQSQLVAQQANPATAVPGVSATYPSQSKSGFTGNAHVRLDYRVSPNLSLGAALYVEKAGNYTEASGLGYARYVFNPIATP